jgi:outer membrane protein insertion porin family
VIEDFFAAQGFLRARVVSVNFKDVSKSTVDVTYEIDSGSETLIRNIQIAGNTAFTSKEIMSKLDISEGGGLKVQTFNTNLNTLVDTYRGLGYADVYIDKGNVIAYSEDYRVANINVHIYEGDKYKIGKIFIEGLVKTKDKVVTREFEFQEGGKVLMSELQETENKLAGLGLFGSVSVIPLPNSVDGPGYKDILVKVEEKKAGTYEFGFGYSTDQGIEGSTGITYGNLGGWNRRVNLDAYVSRRLDDQFRFVQYNITSGYYEPYLWNLPLDFRVTISYDRQDLVDYGERDFNLSFYFQKTIGYNTFIFMNSIQRINVFDASVLTDDYDYWKYSVRQTYTLDTRDSVFSPSKGLYFSTYGEWGRSFESSVVANYLTVSEQARLYIPVFDNWTVVPSFNSGYIKGLHGESILLDERFALGGLNSIRGYREGIIQDLTPQIGSQYFYTNTIEVRRKLFWRLVGIAFHDIGTLSSEDPSVNGPFSSVGGGVSLTLPVGSLSLEYGYVYKIDKRIPPDKVGRLHFSLGTF